MGRPKGSRNPTGMNAPGSRLPRRYKSKGKESGNYFQRVEGGKDVNLKTKNAEIALRRAKLAKEGLRYFEQDDGDAAATSIAATVVGTEAAKSAPVVEPPALAASGLQPGGFPPGSPPATSPTHTAPAALPPIGTSPNGETPRSEEGVKPDGYIPPPRGWADAVADAAAAGGAAAEEDADEEEGPDPELMDGLIEQAAELAVELQLMFQAWLIKKRLEAKAGEVPTEGPQAKGRIVGAKIWKKEIRRMLPGDLGLPGWLLAPLMIGAYTLPVQLGNATPIPKSSEEAAPAPPAEAAA